MFQKNPRFIGMKFPEMSKPETIEKKYLGKLSKKALAFMKACLKMDPAQRINASEALQHPYFDGIRQPSATPMSNPDLRIGSAQPILGEPKLSSGSVSNVPNGSTSKIGGTMHVNHHLQPNQKGTGHSSSSQERKGTQLQSKQKVTTTYNAHPPSRGQVEKTGERSSSLNKTGIRLDKIVSIRIRWRNNRF